ncbi:MAG: hypothetical protein ACI4XM_01195 [Candidatus Coprovivens sp.]
MLEIDYTKDYLYNEELQKLTEQINNTHKNIDEIKFVTDLFHNGICCIGDVLRLIEQLKAKGVKSLKYCNENFSLKRIYGLVNRDDTLYDIDNYYFNPKYPVASLLLGLTKTLEEQLYWENDYDNNSTF